MTSRADYETRTIARVAALAGFTFHPATPDNPVIRLVHDRLRSHVLVYLADDGSAVRAVKHDADGTVGVGYRVNADGVAVGSGSADGVALMVVAWMADAEQLAADCAARNN